MYRSILVGQDSSGESLRALELAIWISGVTPSAKLTLIHLHGRKLPLSTPIPLEDVRALLVQRAVLCHDAGIGCSQQIVEGWTTQALLAETRWHDLVVVGKHGASRNQSARGLGSLSTSLIAGCPVPVLIVDDHADPPRNLLVAFDESPDSCKALRIAATLAIEKRLHLFVVEVVPKRRKEDKLARVQAYLDDCPGLDHEVERLEGSPGDMLVDFIHQHDIQLTFIPSLDRSLSGHKLTDRLADDTNCSLVIPSGRIVQVF